MRPNQHTLRSGPFSILLLALCLSCQRSNPPPSQSPQPSQPASSWPHLPHTPKDAQALIQRWTRRSPLSPTPPTLDLSHLLRRLKQTPKDWQVGKKSILKWLKRQQEHTTGTHYLLLGTTHDAGAQIDIFNHLLSHHGLSSLSIAATELFSSDGRWQGVPASTQRGDTQLLRRFLKKGLRSDWASLKTRQEEHNYTGWKYRYLEKVMALLSTSRATGHLFTGCDIPPKLQTKCKHLKPWRFHLRDLHCFLSLQHLKNRASKRSPHRIAMLWGVDHIKASGFRRFLLPADRATSVYLLGHRPGPFSLEAQLKKHLTLFEPILLPLDPHGQQAILLSPDRWMSGQVDQAKSTSPTLRKNSPNVIVTAETNAMITFFSSDQRASLRSTPHHLKPFAPLRIGLPPTALFYVFQAGEHRMIGTLELKKGDVVRLDFSRARREVRMVIEQQKK